jgi:acyl-CoA reductase-like NAD-dependent aldehyde dehydrogenase
MNGNVVTIDNYIAGKFVPPSTGNYLDVADPADLHIVGKVGISNAADVNNAVSAAEAALPSWSNKTIKARAAIVRSSSSSLPSLFSVPGKDLAGH